jgi:hypothetical protein
MPDDPVLVYARGCYRVVRIDGDDASMAYRIFDSAGTELRREPGFDEARHWVDARLADARHARPPTARQARR